MCTGQKRHRTWLIHSVARPAWHSETLHGWKSQWTVTSLAPRTAWLKALGLELHTHHSVQQSNTVLFKSTGSSKQAGSTKAQDNQLSCFSASLHAAPFPKHAGVGPTAGICTKADSSFNLILLKGPEPRSQPFSPTPPAAANNL